MLSPVTCPAAPDDRWHAALQDNLCDLLSSCGAPVRELAHSLLLRYLQQTPTAADRCVSAYFECLDSGDECVRAMVLDRLPEIVVLAQGESAAGRGGGGAHHPVCGGTSGADACWRRG